MKKRRNRLQHSEASAEEQARREGIRAARDAFYAQRRGERPAIEPVAAEPAKPEPAGVMIPADWHSLHWKKRVAIAKQCYPGAQFINGDDANDAIARYLEDTE